VGLWILNAHRLRNTNRCAGEVSHHIAPSPETDTGVRLCNPAVQRMRLLPASDPALQEQGRCAVPFFARHCAFSVREMARWDLGVERFMCCTLLTTFGNPGLFA